MPKNAKIAHTGFLKHREYIYIANTKNALQGILGAF